MPAWTILRRDPSRRASANEQRTRTATPPATSHGAKATRAGPSRLSFMKELFSRTRSQDKAGRHAHDGAAETTRGTDGSVSSKTSNVTPATGPKTSVSASNSSISRSPPSEAPAAGEVSTAPAFPDLLGEEEPTPRVDGDHRAASNNISTITLTAAALSPPDFSMAALDESDVEKLFSGAPQFFARSLGHGTGAPHPSVAFPWNEELGIRDLTDHTQVEHDAWGSVTASARIILRDPTTPLTPSFKARPHFNSRTTERPNMVSFTGLEKGTIGYQAALELSVADSLQEEQYGFDSIGTKGPVIVEQRQRLITSKDGLRHLDDAAIMEQLLKLEKRYHDDRADTRIKPNDLYHELFHKILHPPTKVIDHNNPYSLAVQIYALVKVLAAPNTWIDFSHVEWRIRLGQILWAFPLDDELDDGSSINEGDNAHDRSEERYWLLLQILLACELLIRLDAITEGDEFGGASKLKAADIHRFDKEANASVKWSLMLARSWLENITITKTVLNNSGQSTPKGWLTSLTAKMHLRHEHMHMSHHIDHTQIRHNDHSEYAYGIKGRYTERQLSGLTQFARRLRWPDVEAYSVKMSQQAAILSDATPINTPIPTTDTQRSSYFDGARASLDSRKDKSHRRQVGAALHANGWLTKSYMSGLILPGEVLSHLLMSTLLENDTHAMSKLGLMANLCGGFVYGGKSFWSTACVVGRVLAAGSGSVECMGWISTDVKPEGLGDGWLDIEVGDVPDDMLKTGKRARIWGKKQIEKESDVIGDGDWSSILPKDFIVPSENVYPRPPPSNVRIELKSLDLAAPTMSVQPTPASEMATPFSYATSITRELLTYPASITFTIMHDGAEEEAETNIPLANDVYFVTAHPCAPSSKVKLYRSPTSPTIQGVDVRGFDETATLSTSSHIIGHPLHKSYTFKAIHVLDLLEKRNMTLAEILAEDQTPSDSASDSKQNSKTIPRVLVVDCVTGITPPMRSSPEMASLSRVSSLSSSFGLDAPATPPLLSSPLSLRRQASNASRSSTNSATTGGQPPKFERIDPPGSASLPGTRRKNFGSDMEILIRALCVEKGWNAVISRKRRGCLACAIREAGALGWRVVIRVE
ncbi:uncharacterized protein B0I36DRAFT_314365 [Microdochium trichocladiopsis]|uniref:Helicase-like protein n=1 Tax=Microdochium trichocladiopsis TaxID=1682393 RepID=A0A9P8YE57_9PEZI|nr:uncharacterized protein B0I36DRAFT_314365 [Microdochium trichocladiopsis]KAH7037579.1 hypothetical protein B0I36DRAFT_314365 [Microdochium trichocladiopsis]